MNSVIYLTDTRYGSSDWCNPSARHRCFHYADALIASGCKATVISVGDASVDILNKFDHAVFHRPIWSRRFQRAIKNCRTAGVRIHADYDDLIFNSDYAKSSPQCVSAGLDTAKVQKQFDLAGKAVACIESFLVSTGYLRDKLREFGVRGNVTVLPNSLPRTFTQPVHHQHCFDKSTIGYFPGSRGHSEDFSSIKAALADLADEDIDLLIVGRMNAQDYAGLSNVHHIPFVSYTDYLRLLMLVDVSIAPLIDNEFNRAKSAVKLIESVSVGTPIVASENQDMLDHENENSLLVTSQAQWYTALHKAIALSLDKDKRELQTARLRDRFSVLSRLPILQDHLQCAA